MFQTFHFRKRTFYMTLFGIFIERELLERPWWKIKKYNMYINVIEPNRSSTEAEFTKK